jgi:hypothetical protein
VISSLSHLPCMRHSRRRIVQSGLFHLASRIMPSMLRGIIGAHGSDGMGSHTPRALRAAAARYPFDSYRGGPYGRF